MKNIVWVFGNSGSGKETFINSTIIGENFLVKNLGWENHLIKKIEESIKYIGQYEDDPITKKRSEILPAVEKIVDSTNTDSIVILLKWQDVDQMKRLPEKLHRNYTDYVHTIIYLRANPDALWERVQQKSWWRDVNTVDKHEYLTEWVRDQKAYAKELVQKGFLLHIIDSTNDYKISDLSLDEA